MTDVSNKHHSKVAAAVEVAKNIWIGDAVASKDKEFMDKVNIRAIINLTPHLPNCTLIDVECIQIPVHDLRGLRDQDLFLQYLPCITEFIYKVAVIEDNSILLHCVKGRQRSAAAMAAYLIKFYDMLPMEAMNYLLARKEDVFHWGKSVNFAEALNKWYHQTSMNKLTKQSVRKPKAKT